MNKKGVEDITWGKILTYLIYILVFFVVLGIIIKVIWPMGKQAIAYLVGLF